jgi:spermidine/putrescine transport system permease protein
VVRSPAPRRRQYLHLLGLLSPAYLILAGSVYIPLAVMIGYSFLSQVPHGGEPVRLSGEHYLTLFRERFYLYLTWRSILMGMQTTVLCVVLAFPLAYILARVVPGRWREALFFLIILPFWTNTLVRIYSWIVVLQPQGFIGRIISEFAPNGILFSYTAILVGLVHGYLPYMILTLYVALQGLDPRVLEAAQSLGARPSQIFLRIVLPLSLPGLIAGAILVFIPVTGAFVEPRLLGGVQGSVIGPVIVDQFLAVFNWPLGAAISFMLLLTILVALSVVLRLRPTLVTQR